MRRPRFPQPAQLRRAIVIVSGVIGAFLLVLNIQTLLSALTVSLPERAQNCLPLAGLRQGNTVYGQSACSGIANLNSAAIWQQGTDGGFELRESNIYETWGDGNASQVGVNGVPDSDITLHVQNQGVPDEGNVVTRITADGDAFPRLQLDRINGVGKTNREWSLAIWTNGNFGITDNTAEPSNNFVFTTGGRFGIGDPTPDATLDVAGDVRIDGDTYLPFIYDSDSSSYYLNPNSVSNINRLHLTSARLYFTSTAAPNDDFIYHNDSNNTMYFNSDTSNDTAGNMGILAYRLYDHENAGYYVDPGDSSRMNSIYPNYLSSYGDIRADDDLYIYGDEGGSSQIFMAASSGWGNAIEVKNDGWLRLNDDNNFSNGIYTPGNFRVDGVYLGDHQQEMFRTSDEWLRINQDGDFTSGVYTPGVLRIDGHFEVKNGIQDANANQLISTYDSYMRLNQSDAYTSGVYTKVFKTHNLYRSNEYGWSDKRLKKDIHSISKGRDVVTKLRPVSFRWDEEAQRELYDSEPLPQQDDSQHIGFIAQEVEQILPDTVIEDETTGMKLIEDKHILAYVVKAFQELDSFLQEQIAQINQQIEQLFAADAELQEQVDAQQKVIDQQQEQIEQLEQRLERIESSGEETEDDR